jgi:D-alanine-D-alanine ligase
MKFPLIVKPNAEGSSKGIDAKNVVDTEEELRAAVKNCVEKYRQPALIEEYITGREFTVGLLGDKRPRVLPPMEIKFKKNTKRPVYDYAVKQEWEEHVYYECPAKLTESEQRAMEKIARATFWALDCRDVARVDMRMDAEGRIYVLEVNPLPGLTPGYSDLVLIAKACGMEYDQLIAEIMTGGLRRMREKRREERELEREREAAAQAGKAAVVVDKDKQKRQAKLQAASVNGGTDGNGNGNGSGHGNGHGHGSGTGNGGASASGSGTGNGNGTGNGGANGNGGAHANGGTNGNGHGHEDAPIKMKRERSEPVAASGERERPERGERGERERAKSDPGETVPPGTVN